MKRLLFLPILILLFLTQTKVAFAQNKCGVNVGPYYNQVSQVHSMAKKGGWVVALGTLGDCGGYSNLFGKDLNVVLRAYNGGQAFTAAQATAWAATLGQLDTKGQKVYFMPWNEPNQGKDEGGDTKNGKAVLNYVKALKKDLSDAGLLDTKVVLLSPMLNKTHGDFNTFLNSVGGADAFYKLAAGSSINEYDFATDKNNYVACQHSNNYLNNCKYNQINIPGPYYALESGATGIYDVPRYEDKHISTMLNGSWDSWKDGAFKMFAIFSYDPLPGGPAWDIFSAKQTKSFYQANCSAGAVEMMSGFDQKKFDSWLQSKSKELTTCGACGFAPSSAPGFCSAVGKQDGYDSSRFEDYNANPDEFYIQPIKGLTPVGKNPSAEELWGGRATRQTSMIRNDLISQGYEASCATPGFKIQFSKKGQPWMETFLKGPNTPNGVVYGGQIIYPGGYKNAASEGKPFRSTLTFDYRELLTPLFRDVEDKKFQMASLEELFGFKDKTENPSEAEINSAPINSLVSNSQRCALSIKMLLKQKEMCQKLANPDACALYTRTVPTTTWNIKQTLEKYQSYITAHQAVLTKESLSGLADDDKTISFVCDQLTADRENYLDKELKVALLQVPLTLDRSYRLAFLVTSIEMKYPRGTKSMFNFFEHPNAGFFSGGPSKPDHGILVTAFKVPDITTNQGDGGTSNTAWQDASVLTRNTLLTQEQLKTTKQKDTERTNKLMQEAKKYDSKEQKASDEIFCLVGKAPDGIGAPECNDPLSKALTDIINAQAKISKTKPEYNPFESECPDLEKEYSDTINDPGSFGNTSLPSKLYTTTFGADLLNQLFIDSSHMLSSQDTKPNPQFAETWREEDPEYETNNSWGGLRDWGLKNIFYVIPEMRDAQFPYDECCDAVKVKHFLVYPEGYTLKSIEDVLAGSFFSQTQLASLTQKEKDFDRFEASGAKNQFEGASFNKDFDDWSPDPPNGPVEGKPECAHERIIGYRADDTPITETYYALPCKRSFGFEISQLGKFLQPGLLGGKLGFWVRNVQQQLHDSSSAAWSYLASCKNTEQFLLGQCGASSLEAEKQDPDTCSTLSCAPKPTEIPQPTPTPVTQAGCVRGERGREMCIKEGKLYIYDHNVDLSGDGTADEYCGGHVSVNSSTPAGCGLTQQKLWGFSSPGGPLAYELGCDNLTQVTATFDSTGGSCSQEKLSVTAN